MDELTKKIAKLIRDHRVLKKYSQEYIASQLNISQQAYQKIESGKTKIDLSYAVVLVQILEINFEKIYQTADYKFENKKLFIDKTNIINLMDHLTNEILYHKKLNTELMYLLNDKI